jgi:ATP-dependent RNA helicase RhlE
MTFDSLQIIEPILRALKNEGYQTPTPIQSQTIPLTLAGKDILGCAQTGTGKTAAFAIPILQLLEAKPVNPKQRKIRSLIVTPTRELAIQIGESFDAYGKFTQQKNTVIFGGVGQKPQTDALQRGVDILIATPGRLLDLCQQGYVHFRDLEIFVLDEADRMLDMGFIHDIRKLIALLPKQRQSLFFSATMPPEITKLASSILIRPERVEVTPVSSTAETITQYLLYTDKGNKNALLLHVLEDKAIKSALVFTRTKHGADKVVKFLQHHHIKAEAIHGNKAQNARQRALNNFKSGETRVLVATDIAARGIDVDDLGFVINFEIPNIPETYVHRIGRTGRAGASGIALSFCDASEKPFLKDIEKLTGIKIPVKDQHPYPLMDHNPPPPEKKQHQGRNNQQRRPERQAKPQPGNSAHAPKIEKKQGGFRGKVI